MVAICPPGHALAGLAVVTPGDLGAHSLVALDADTRMGAAVRHAFQSARQPFLFRAEVRSCSTACALVGTGTGVSVVDPFSAAYPPSGTLEIRPFEPAIPSIAYAFWSGRTELPRTARRFLAETTDVIRRSLNQAQV